MPVRKFRTLEAWQAAKNEDSLPCEDPRLAARIRENWRRGSRLAPLGGPRGVHKYRSIEEMQADRERWEDERIARLRAERLQT